ncbi:tape measure protein [uncultured Rhodospira sp.]|uniref:tape measure protein n=1 Tax=uncultured Rhodospira sp. TaxID=1936189 RepID=UPI0026066929|nr:tape measure protein [uncultured Rhodospira sp.]
MARTSRHTATIEIDARGAITALNGLEARLGSSERATLNLIRRTTGLDQAYRQQGASQRETIRITSQHQKQLERFTRQHDPLLRAKEQLARHERLYSQAVRHGAHNIDRYTTALQRHRESVRRLSQQHDEAGRAAGRARGGVDAFGGALARLPGPIESVARSLGPVGIALGVVTVGAGLAASAIARAGDEYTASVGKLNASIGDMTRAKEVYEDLYQTALTTGVELAASAGQFTRFKIAAAQIGATDKEVAQLVETVQKLGVAGGTSVQEITAASIQLGQGLASGRLQGDELRSIMENMPVLAQALAAELGVTTGELRAMGAAGELTGERVFQALSRAAGKADEMFDRMPMTIERASYTLDTAWDRFLAKLDEGLGLSQGIAAALHDAALWLDRATAGMAKTTENAIADIDRQIADLKAGTAGGVFGTGVNLFGGSSVSFGANAEEIARLEKQRRLYEMIADDVERFGQKSEEMAKKKAEETARQRENTEALAAFEQLQTDLMTPIERANQKYAERMDLLDRAAAAGADAAAIAKLQAAVDRELAEALAKTGDAADHAKRSMKALQDAERARARGIDAAVSLVSKWSDRGRTDVEAYRDEVESLNHAMRLLRAEGIEPTVEAQRRITVALRDADPAFQAMQRASEQAFSKMAGPAVEFTTDATELDDPEMTADLQEFTR